jgi:S-DNA-T family DNA segregation ATPase FtsK/SpoIIIE
MEGLTANPKKGSLIFAIGKDIVGNSISYDLSRGPHYLIAGATGSGKSVCLHVMLVSLLMRYSPEELKLVLVDPKSVEFRKYEHIPHLLVDEIITEPKRVLTLLQWAYDETNRRNDMFTACGGEISNIDDYNSMIASDTVPKLPRIVFFIDELADLMESCKKDLEARIRMIAAKSRSAGIHLVLATQRPSVDVITGTIKANLPSRIALKVTNFADSQIILNEAGAEKLLGNGDMLYKDLTMSNYERYQGAYISGREITNVVNYIKEHNTAYFDDEVQEFLDRETRPKQEEAPMDNGGDNGTSGEGDNLFKNALWLAVTSGNISISALQRRFRVGYARAGSIVDEMERKGFISANEGSKARRTLLTREEFINRFGSMEDEGY